MTLVPSRGHCQGVFLLAYAARASEPVGVVAWVAAARRTPTVMASALNLAGFADLLIDRGLAGISADGAIWIDQRLVQAGSRADDITLRRIAVVLLEAERPSWLHTSLKGEQFAPEFVPSSAMNALEWLGEDLEAILFESWRSQPDDGFLEWLGALGESLVMALLAAEGYSATQVSKISDWYGYDILVQPPRRRRLEVKTSVEGTDHRVFLSKNEANKAILYADEWFLVHVVVARDALAKQLVTPAEVVSVRIVDSRSVLEVLPKDTRVARWVSSAEVSISGLAMQPYPTPGSAAVDWRWPARTSPG
jgi:hypothetical protein